jgi:transmembrane sensor
MAAFSVFYPNHSCIMNKHHFHQLLSRYRSGECTEREERLVNQWFALIDDDTLNAPQSDIAEKEERLWHAIQSKTRLVSVPEADNKYWLFNWRWAAAAILVLAAWAGYQMMHLSGKNGTHIAGVSGKLISQMNTSATPMLVKLPDGTQVTIQPQSSIEYPAEFQSDKREILLQGKAFFEVVRDERKPFLVHTGEITTKVLGTSFWIDQPAAGNAVEVSVVTGKVSVFQKDKEKEAESGDIMSGVVLSRNQKVKYTPDNKTFIAMLVDQPVAQAAYKNAFVFDDARLPQVTKMLEKAYGIEVVLENKALKNCLFTADINKEPMFTQLDLISAALNASYEVHGTKVYLNGKGCP